MRAASALRSSGLFSIEEMIRSAKRKVASACLKELAIAEQELAAARRVANRYERHITLQTIPPETGAIDSDQSNEPRKTAITREEPKDYSRVIAANMMAEAIHERTTRENNVRIILGVVGALGLLLYRTFWTDKERELEKQKEEFDKKIEESEEEIKKGKEELEEVVLLIGQIVYSFRHNEVLYEHSNHLIDGIFRANDIESVSALCDEYKKDEDRRSKEAEAQAKLFLLQLQSKWESIRSGGPAP